ncbi:PLP-dependent aminotransferase family protein [Paenibacillus chartarius]|uniref:PLP-dependent aminotransferase family protein n=1 Tax=Paenibacillus chartarius TaxID=747481 RepID=A0ABV6DSL6_9BACL
MRKYVHLMSELESQLEDGTIRGGGRLPSIRELSARYGCSKGTVIKAFAELEKRHLIYTVPQSGYYAVVKTPAAGQESGRSAIDFSAASPDPELFPYLDFQHCLNKAIDMYRNDLFTYGTPQGLPSLLHILCKHLAGSQVFAKPEQMVVTTGAQQALHILATMPFPNAKRAVLLEQPSYHLMIQLLETHGVPAYGIVRTEQGIDLDMLEHRFRTDDVKMFYTIPRFHNPLGTSYPERTKKAIAELARRYDVYVVEDDYLADLETDTKADPIYAYDSSHVVYLRSFSKLLFPGLRLGLAILPPALQGSFKLHKQLSDIDSSLLSQAALEIYMQNGMYERRRHKLAATYQQRMKRLKLALDEHNDTVDVRHAAVKGGAHTHLKLPERLHIPTLLKRLRQRDIVVKDSASCYLTPFEKLPLLRLSISQAPEERIEAGIRVIFEEIGRMAAKWAKQQ